MYQKIVLAADGSEHSLRSAEHAIQLAKLHSDAHIDIVYVVDQDKVKSDVLQNWNTADFGEKGRDRLKPIEKMAMDSDIDYEIKVIQGEPGPSIVDYVNKNKADMVVIGSRGLNVFQEFVLGSVSHKVAKRANCPVMIVK